MFAALNFRWVLVWTCVIVFCFATQSTQGPAQFVTQPSIAIGKLTHPQLKTKSDDYFLNPDDDSNNQDQDLQIRGKKPQKEKTTPAAKQSKRFLAMQSQKGKKSQKSSTSTPLYETNPAVDELANQLGGMKLKSPSLSASRSRGWGRIGSFARRSFSRSKRYLNLSSLSGSKTHEEPIERSSSMSDSDNKRGYDSA